jgi:hypothetical protein
MDEVVEIKHLSYGRRISIVVNHISFATCVRLATHARSDLLLQRYCVGTIRRLYLEGVS